MKALIFGAGGQVGRALARAAPAGAELVALERSDCDVTCGDAVAAALEAAKADLVFNAAAFTAVDQAEREPQRAHLVNAVAPGLIAAACRRLGARLVHISTDYVFGGSGGSPLPPSAAPDPVNVYGRTKLDGEQAASAADPAALIVRTSWVYSGSDGNFATAMLRRMRDGGEVAVVDDQVGTPTWAPSLAQALWGLATLRAEGVHHYGDAGVASWYDFAVAIEEEARAAGLLKTKARVAPISSQDRASAARRPPYSVLDRRAAWSLLGGPAPHWRSNLRRHVRELCGHG